VYEYLEELDQMNWSARGNVNTSRDIHTLPSVIVNFLLNSLNAPITFVVCATNQS
jgi:hypothetical protein